MKKKSILLICLSVMFFSLVACSPKKKDIGADAIANKLIENGLLVTSIKDTKSSDLKSNPFGMISKVYVDIDNTTILETDAFKLCIEVYENNQAALLREYSITNHKIWYKQFFAENHYPDWAVRNISFDDFVEKENVYLYGNVVLRINGLLSEDIQATISKGMDKIISSYEQTEINMYDDAEFNSKKTTYEKAFFYSYQQLIPTIDNSITLILDNVIVNLAEDYTYESLTETYNLILPLVENENLKEKASEVIEILDKKMETELTLRENNIKNINDKVTKVENNSDYKIYDEVNDLIDNLRNSYDNTYYSQSIEGWNTRLAAVKDDVEKNRKEKELIDFMNSCNKVGYKELFRNSEDYRGKPLYFKGEIIQIVDQTSTSITMRVDVTKVYGFYSDTIYVVYENSDGIKKFLEDDIIKIYAIGGGEITYETIMGANVTIPRVYAKHVILE